MLINEVRKEDDLFYQGPFWIIANSFLDILRGNFSIIGSKFECNYAGNYINNDKSKSQKTHKIIWRDNYAKIYNTDDFMFYPRGRVSIYNGIAFIHINSRCNLPKIIDSIVDEYNLNKLDVEIDCNDTYQGSHYDFKLK